MLEVPFRLWSRGSQQPLFFPAASPGCRGDGRAGKGEEFRARGGLSNAASAGLPALVLV